MSRRSSLQSLILLLLMLFSSLFVTAQAKPVDAEGHPWWQHAVFYEIYPRSFADSNNDGIGDLNGISSKMNYLHELGVDAIWITPCYPSPQVDFGYDVSDYENIDPMYGTLSDFDHMVAEGRKHHVRIILDFVLNHTSDQHPWFLDSKSSRTAPHRDWYIWRDGKAPGQPPNNWISLFGGPAWKFDPHHQSVLLSLLLRPTTGPQLAQSRGRKSDARYDPLVVPARRLRIPPRRG